MDTYSLVFTPSVFYHYMGVKDLYVSRRHAALELRGSVLYILDRGHEGRGSLNSTFVNGERTKSMKPHPLEHGDEISL